MRRRETKGKRRMRKKRCGEKGGGGRRKDVKDEVVIDFIITICDVSNPNPFKPSRL